MLLPAVNSVLGCNTRICGTRYKCMHPSCPDYDLCENCEAAPSSIHPNNHPMLKIKTPLRVNFKSSYSQRSRSLRGSGFGAADATDATDAAEVQDKVTGELSVRPSRHGHLGHHHRISKEEKKAHAHAHGDAFGKRKAGGWCQHSQLKETLPSPALAKYVSEIFIPANEVVEEVQDVKGKGKAKEMESEPVTPKAEEKEFILTAAAAPRLRR